MAAYRRALWSAVFLGSFVLVTASARTEDWPQWGGTPGRNMVSSESGLPEFFRPGRIDPKTDVMDPASGENLRWAVRLGSETHGSPVIADGRVYVGTNFHSSERRPAGSGSHVAGGRLVCLEEGTGRLLWELLTPHMPESVAPHSDTGYGICSSPTVDGDRLYVNTNNVDVLCLDVAGLANGNDGPFQDEGRYLAGAFNQPKSPPPPVELKPTDADVLWRYDMLAEHDVHPHDASSCSVLVDGNFLYVCTGNGINRGETKVLNPLAPSLIVLDKRTGRLLAADDEKIGTRILKGQWSSPSLWQYGGRKLIVYGGGDGFCYAFEPLSDPAPDRPVTLKKVWAVECNPAYCRSRNGRPVGYREKDGPSEIVGTPVCLGKRVYVTIGRDPNRGAGKGNVTCIDAERGVALWNCDQIGRSMSTVSVADGLLYVAETFGVVHCLDAETGQICWTHKIHERIWGSTMVADGKVYVPTSKNLLVFAAGREKKLLAEVKLPDPCLSTPVAANGALYLATQEYLYAIAERGARAAPQVVSGSKPPAPAYSAAPIVSTPVLSDDWTQWRGAGRDGRVPHLPKTLATLEVLWQQPVAGACDAGIAVAGDRVVMADHDKRYDYYVCRRASNGKELWRQAFPNGREMDYGSGPRATPLICRDKVYVLRAFGELHCLNMMTGTTVWQRDLVKDFGVKKVPTWGYCASPLLADGKLIVNPGGKAALVALDPVTGDVVWRGEGGSANYSSFIVGDFGGIEQVVGYDAKSLGGWELKSGRRLWSLKVDISGGYVVPTPVAVGGNLLIADLNNPAQLFTFDNHGVIREPGIGMNEDLVPDVSTPVAEGDLILGVAGELLCLNASDGLKPFWRDDREDVFASDCHLMVAADRGLAFNSEGDLVLFHFDRHGREILGKQHLCGKTLMHPSLTAGRLYVRDGQFLYCYQIDR